MMKNKIKIIYIICTGHSGSSLLSLILGSSINCYNLGELKSLEIYVKKPKLNYEEKLKLNKNAYMNYKCDCGKDVLNCEFWNQIIKKIDVNKLIFYKTSFFEKIKYSSYILLGKKPKEIFFEEFKLYQELSKKLKGKKYGDVEYIIDSSKNLKKLYNLLKLDLIDVNVIYLKRDGRGVVNSYEKLGIFWLKSYLNWLIANLFISIFCKKNINSKNLYELSYDNFVKNPVFYLNELNKKFNLKIDLENYLKNINSKITHSIGGNNISRKKISSIKYDKSWKKRMSKSKQIILSMLTYVPNKFWVYNKE